MPTEVRVASPPAKPLLVYDDDCQFCRRWVARWQRATGDAISYLPFQTIIVESRFPEIALADFEKSIHLILPDGSVYRGAEAVFRSLAAAGKEKWLLSLYEQYPFFEEITELVYEEIAEHRSFLSRLDRIYAGPGLQPLSYLWVRFWFLRGLALIYLLAFGSLAPQIQGLAGSDGIQPVAVIMRSLKTEAAVNHIGWRRFHAVPTLCWWNASDSSLRWQCGAGLVLSVLLFCGIAPAPVLFLLWILYLSLSTVCVPFLDFQWDSLLLETGFLAIFFAPWQWVERPSRQSRPSTLVLWLLRWLIFRLMLESGCVKLTSGDPTWWHLTALRVHYQTQPLPTWIGWYAHQLPAWFQSFSVVVMFFIELVGPVFIIAGRRMRIIAAGIFVFFQVVILLTGNYGFFNYLTILLCLPLLDDTFLVRRPKKPVPETLPDTPPAIPPQSRRWPRIILVPVSVVVGLATFIMLLSTLLITQRWPAPVLAVFAWVEPLRSFNGYGLFRVMTQTRPEIILEGSNDGHEWLAYEFKYKPGDLRKRPAFVAPYQPRLDWQMWFAALQGPQGNPWVINLEARLLENSPSVVKLLARNPFPTKPPKFIRAQLFEYQFTDRATRRATGQWWQREYKGVFLPPISRAAVGPSP